MKNDGGVAFPGKQLVTTSGPEFGKLRDTTGMSLRDWFAGHALAGLVSDQPQMQEIAKVADRRKMLVVSATAISCYEFADAMLKAREQT